MLSAYCRFSLATVEFLFSPTNVFCALIEQEYPGVWRWAVYDTQDIVLMEGAEPTQTEAKQAAVDGLMNNRHACI